MSVKSQHERLIRASQIGVIILNLRNQDLGSPFLGCEDAQEELDMAIQHLEVAQKILIAGDEDD